MTHPIINEYYKVKYNLKDHKFTIYWEKWEIVRVVKEKDNNCVSVQVIRGKHRNEIKTFSKVWFRENFTDPPPGTIFEYIGANINNNQGRSSCFICGLATEKRDTGFFFMDVCPKCGR